MNTMPSISMYPMLRSEATILYSALMTPNSPVYSCTLISPANKSPAYSIRLTNHLVVLTIRPLMTQIHMYMSSIVLHIYSL